jgi:hypothetical protein
MGGPDEPNPHGPKIGEGPVMRCVRDFGRLRRKEKSDRRRGASTTRKLDLKKMVKVERFGRLQGDLNLMQPVQRAKNRSSMIKFRSRNNRASKNILDTLKTRKLRFRKIHT